jgi:hypothetical protein
VTLQIAPNPAQTQQSFWVNVGGAGIEFTQAAGASGQGEVSGMFYDWNTGMLPSGDENILVDGQTWHNGLANPYAITLSTGQHTITPGLSGLSGYAYTAYSLQGGPRTPLNGSVPVTLGSSGDSLSFYFLPANVSLSNLTLNSSKTYEAYSSITAGTAVTVSPGAGVTFHAGSQIVLTPGFTAGGPGGTGTSFQAVIGSNW